MTTLVDKPSSFDSEWRPIPNLLPVTTLASQGQEDSQSRVRACAGEASLFSANVLVRIVRRMEAYSPYVQTLEQLFLNCTVRLGTDSYNTALAAALDGQPAARLRELITVHDRRSAGAFFTPGHLAKRAVAQICKSVTPKSVVLDPACGAGDLLIALASTLPIRSTLSGTVDRWSSTFWGLDLYPEFIRAAKLRLMLLAINRGVRVEDDFDLVFANAFQSLRVGSGVTDSSAVRGATHILLNPPYSKVIAPHDCQWASGTINFAAEFVHFCLSNAQPRTKISAILPDVLRSGTRYRRWRDYVLSRCTVESVELAGLFDAHADVDVFILTGTVTKTRHSAALMNWGGPRRSMGPKISEMFEVAVGAVVPFRDPKRGPLMPYVTPKSSPPWRTIRNVAVRRRFGGRTFSPPFVVVRRTSRPGDLFRAVPTIILGEEPIAVENHLLVASPIDGKATTCRKLVRSLRDPRTTDWLDKRLRCRHLTTESLAELPMLS